jgi:agmatine deiminase
MTVFISEHLGNTDRGKNISKELQKILGEKLLKIPNTNKNEWCRDYMPVKGFGGHLVLFKYSPSYIVGRTTLEKTIPDQKQICNKLGLEYTESSIILDGGAIEIFEDIGIISDRVIVDNCSGWVNLEPIVLNNIKKILKLSRLIVVPSDPWDFTGHVDGMVRFIDKNTVLVNDSTTLDKAIMLPLNTEFERQKYQLWKDNFKLSLINAGLKIEILPCAVSSNEDDAETDATGIYLNFLLFEDKIIMPSFEEYPEYNIEAKEKLGKLYNREVFLIEATLLAQHGGIINCVTWTF